MRGRKCRYREATLGEPCHRGIWSNVQPDVLCHNRVTRDADICKPRLWAERERRRMRRVPITQKVLLRCGQEEIEGETVDMSLSGMLVRSARTFPLGSIVRVTNLKTGHTALVRITDRGPFIPGRIIDLSLAAAYKLDVWQPGTAEVKV